MDILRIQCGYDWERIEKTNFKNKYLDTAPERLTDSMGKYIRGCFAILK